MVYRLYAVFASALWNYAFYKPFSSLLGHSVDGSVARTNPPSGILTEPNLALIPQTSYVTSNQS